MNIFCRNVISVIIAVVVAQTAEAQTSTENIAVLGSRSALEKFQSGQIADGTGTIEFELTAPSAVGKALADVTNRKIRRVLILDDAMELAESLTKYGDQLLGFDRITYLTSTSRTRQLEVLNPVIRDNMKVIYLNPTFEKRLAERTTSEENGGGPFRVSYDFSALYTAATEQLAASDGAQTGYKPWISGIWMSGIVDGFGRLQPAAAQEGNIAPWFEEKEQPKKVKIAPMWKNDVIIPWPLETASRSLNAEQRATHRIITQTCDDWDDRTIAAAPDIRFQPFGFVLADR